MTPLRPKKPEPASTRRRPTDTPDQRASAFSYHASRSTREANVGRELTRESPNPPSVQRKPLIIIGVILAIAFFVSLQSTGAHIKVLGSVESKELLQSTSVYQDAASKLLAASVANHIKPLTDNAAIEGALRTKFPELTAVTVSQSVWHNYSTVTIEAVRPVMILMGNGGTFVIDDNGVARVPASQLSDTARASLPVVDDQSGLTLAAGHAALPGTDVAFIEQILAQLKQADVSWQQLTLPSGSSELDVKITDQPYFVKFALRGGADARQQAGTYLAVKDKVTPTQYIDVRVPERAFYK